jgi:GH15 family glucan-1,4-alpha-glucosidase
VYRYRDPIDGLQGGEGAFSICTLWFIDGLTLSGQLDATQRLFERMLGYSNDLGLYSEEIDPGIGELRGNFPQVFTHLALINAALNLTKAQQRGQRRLQGDQAERAASVQQA